MTNNIYEQLWAEEEKKKEDKIQKTIVANLPRGKPRTGIKGTYLRKLK